MGLKRFLLVLCLAFGMFALVVRCDEGEIADGEDVDFEEGDMADAEEDMEGGDEEDEMDGIHEDDKLDDMDGMDEGEQLEEVMQDHDANKDGKLSLDELLNHDSQGDSEPEALSEEEKSVLKKNFKTADVDGDGFIHKEELPKFLSLYEDADEEI